MYFIHSSLTNTFRAILRPFSGWRSYYMKTVVVNCVTVNPQQPKLYLQLCHPHSTTTKIIFITVSPLLHNSQNYIYNCHPHSTKTKIIFITVSPSIHNNQNYIYICHPHSTTTKILFITVSPLLNNSQNYIYNSVTLTPQKPKLYL